MKKRTLLIVVAIALMLTELLAWVGSIVYFSKQSFAFMPYYTPAGTALSLIISFMLSGLCGLPSFNDIPLIIQIIYCVICAGVIPLCALLIRAHRVVCAIYCIKGNDKMLPLAQTGIWISIVFHSVVFTLMIFFGEISNVALSTIVFAVPTVIYAALLMLIGKAKKSSTISADMSCHSYVK